jgi:outer membrane scaffolding protein for murein synthesis (MipA/OmpV family)
MRCLLLAVFVLASAHASAQGGFFGFTEGYEGGGAADVGDGEARLRVGLGLGVGAGPNFQGSDRYRIRPAPFVFAGYGRFFVGFGGIGVNLYRAPGWGFGAIVSPSQGRREDADQRLAGLGDVDRTVNFGVYGVTYTRQFLTRAVFYTDIGGEGQGSLARLDVLARFRVDERTRFFAGPGLSWGSRQYSQAFFGVTAEQAARSQEQFPEFQAGAGVNNLRLTAGANHRFAPNWNLISSVTASRLSGHAGNSPIVETRQQYGAFLSAIYLFR